METLLVFILIIAGQLLSAYFKQKKKKLPPILKDILQEPKEVFEENPKENIPKYEAPEEVVEETDEAEDYEEEYFKPEEHREFEHKENRFLDAQHSYKSMIATEPVIVRKSTPKKKVHIDLTKPELGIVWAAILHEPRYKAKWSRKF